MSGAAYSHTLTAAANAGVGAAVQTRIGALFDNSAPLATQRAYRGALSRKRNGKRDKATVS
jgi:hypothetical protein